MPRRNLFGVTQRHRQLLAKLGLLALLLPGLLPVTAQAATASATLTVSVLVPASCQITATPLAFGIYTGAVDMDPSTLSITCSNTTAYTVSLNAGLGTSPAATVTTRHMNGPAAGGLAYQLHRDAGRTQNWGQTIGTDTVAGTGNGNAQVLTVYGQIAAGQLVPPGTYSDTIVATVTY